MTENTVYVIGAGASKEANLPTGEELKDIIARMLDFRFNLNGQRERSGDDRIFGTFKKLVRLPNGQHGDIRPYLDEAWHIRDALPQAISIDNFIDSQKGKDKLALCGKLGIVCSILNAEKSSFLFVDTQRANSTINFEALKKTWYSQFFKKITENCTVDDLEKRFKTLTLIVFNYDRCVEHFLYFALQNYYRINGEAAAALIRNINIYHPYGAVGSLPWLNQAEGVKFGLDPDPEQLLDIAEKIKTFTEGTDPSSSEIDSIRKKIDQANRLVFLGFAFHPLNMELITPEKFLDKSPTKCFGTINGVSSNDQNYIENDLRKLNKQITEVELSYAKCHTFFSEFWRGLSF